MQVFQVIDNICFYKTPYQSIQETVGKYPADVVFVEAPDWVREGYIYIDGEFQKPTPPDGMLLDEKTGTFYPADSIPMSKFDENIVLIEDLKAELSKTDYKALKYAEGWLSDEEYAPIKAERQALRDKINELEGEIIK